MTTPVSGASPKILVAGLCGIGDLVFFLPALAALRKTWPGATIDLLTFPNGAGAVVPDGLIDGRRSLPVDKWGYGKGGAAAVASAQVDAIRSIREARYDLCLWPFAHTTPRKKVLSILFGAKKTVMHAGESSFTRWPWFGRHDVLPFEPGSHLIDRNADVARAAGAAEVSSFVDLRLTLAELADAEKFLASIGRGPWAGFHPGGNLKFSGARQWDPSRFGVLAKELAEKRKLHPIFFCSNDPEERAAAESLGNSLGVAYSLAVGLPIRVVAAVLSRLALFVGNDSSLVHIAAAAGIPVTAVHGPTNPGVTGPRGFKAGAVRLDLPCSPCYDTGYSTQCPHRSCLGKLSPAAVLAVAESTLAGPAVEPVATLPAPGALDGVPSSFWVERSKAQRRFDRFCSVLRAMRKREA